MDLKKYMILILFIFLSSPARGEHRASVLFLSSGHWGNSSVLKLAEGLRDTLENEDILLYIEFSDAERFPGEENIALFAERLQFKIANRGPYDLIITGDDVALDFVFDRRDSLFEGIPLIFTGVRNVETALEMNNEPLITGIIEQVSIKETADLIIEQNRRINGITALVDGSAEGRRYLQSFLSLEDSFPDYELKTIDLADHSWDEFAAALGELGRKEAVLLLSARSDRTGAVKDFHDSLELITSSLDSPLYYLRHQGIGEGIVGGLVVDQYEQGKAAANLALRVIGGEDISGIEVQEKSPNRYVFDYDQLIFHKISFAAVPPSSLILNEPYSFYNAYESEIWIITLMFLTLLLSLLILLLNYYRWIKADRAVKKLEQAVDQSPIAIVITDAKGKIEYVNRNLCRETGYSREELIGKTPSVFTDKEKNQTDYEDMWETISAGSEWEGRFYNRTKEGKPYCENALVTPVFDNKQVITHFIAIKEDITEKLERDRLNSILLAAIEQNEDTLEIFDLDRKVIYVNPSFLRIHNLRVEDVMGKTPLDYFPDSSKDNQAKYEGLWQIVESGKNWRGQFANKNADGSLLYQDVSVSPLFDKEGRIISYASIKKDITELVSLMEERTSIQEHMFKAQKRESVGQLANGMANDFNNILSGIMSASQLLLMPERQIDEKARKYGNMIFTSCQRGADLVSRLLNFSQSSRSSARPVKIVALVEETLEILKHTVRKSIDFTLIADFSAELIKCEPSSIQNALLNLGFNSSQAIEREGRIGFKISDRILDRHYCDESDFKIGPGRYCAISVSDTGTGIPEEIQGKIFLPFFTTKGDKEGAGLGLSSVRRIVEEHKGAVEMASAPGKGSVFTLLLPIGI